MCVIFVGIHLGGKQVIICVCNEDFALVCSGYQVCAMKDNHGNNAMRCDDNDPKISGYQNMCVIKDSNSNGETVGRDAKDPKTRGGCVILYLQR